MEVRRIDLDKHEISSSAILSSFISERLNIKNRGFEVISDEHRKYPEVDILLPVRGDSKSAGYDLRTPVEITLKPNERKLVFTDVKAYMNNNEVLEVYVRSSIGVKKGVVLSNGTGIIDSSYYSNPSNDGNIGIALWNTTDKEVVFEAQERICQCVFKTYLVADDDICANLTRTGGFGSTGNI